MRAILVILSVSVLAYARPNVSNGYQYDTPQGNYQAAAPQQTNNYGLSGETLPNFVPVQSHSGPGLPPVYPETQQPDNFIPTGPSEVQLQGVPQFVQTAPEQQSISNQDILQSTGPEGHRYSNDAIVSGIPQQQQVAQQSIFGGSSQQQSFSNNFQQQSVSSSFAQTSQNDELPPIITKHFYVHAAPEEPEESQGPRFVNVGRKQKNYKIIFIKAPTYGFNSQVIPIIQPNEEKTIVYVLSKKPSFNQDISLPPIPVTEPSKPEVFFIKYKTDSEAQEAQQKIQGAYETANLGVSNDNVFTNVGGVIGSGISGLQNQASSAFNAAAGHAQGLLSGFTNSIGSIFGSPSGSSPSAPVQTQTVSDEELQTNDNTNSVNLVDAQSEQAQQQQNDGNDAYLPPNNS